MAEESKPKRKRGRPAKAVTKKYPLREGEHEAGAHREVEQQASNKPASPDDEYFRIIVHDQEGQSKQVGPFWGYAPGGVSHPPIWLYRGQKVIVPYWVKCRLDDMNVKTFEHDMSVIPPQVYEVYKTRAPYDILERGLTKKDFEEFKAEMNKRKHDPWKQTYTQAR